MNVKLKFSPNEIQEYNFKIPIFLPKICKKKPCFFVSLAGFTCFPQVLFDRTEIILPAVSLNLAVTCDFAVYNDGYENEVLKFKVVDDFSHFNLLLTAKDEPILAITKQKINFQIKFSSESVISFTTKLLITDSFDQEFALSVSATADNCQLTTWMAGSDESKAGNENQQQSESLITPYSVDLSNIETERQIMQRYLNFYVFEHALERFPTELNFEKISILLKFFNPALDLQYLEIEHPADNDVQSQVKVYSELIKQLQIKGAQLNHVRSYFLLNFEQFQRWQILNPIPH